MSKVIECKTFAPNCYKTVEDAWDYALAIYCITMIPNGFLIRISVL